MVGGKKVLAIIPARGGSKSIPGKNVRFLGGFPLITYSIAAGLLAKYVDRVIVSTDSNRIAKVSREFGAEVPFMRPKELALDDTPDLPVFAHILKWLLENEKYKPDIIVHLRPTSPFREQGSIDEGIEILLGNKRADCVRAVVPCGQNPYKMWRLGKKGEMLPLLKAPRGVFEPYNAPRQKLPATYWQTGHLDVIRYETIMAKGSMTGKVIFPLILDSRLAIDIDSEFDWSCAEWLIKHHDLPIVKPKD